MHDSEFGSSPLAITDQCVGNKQSRKPGREGFGPDEAFPLARVAKHKNASNARLRQSSGSSRAPELRLPDSQ
jgi:hypothetical protein